MSIAISGKKLTAVRRRLKAANARFKKLTKAQQRLAIAKDVIFQLKMREIKAGSTYLTAKTLYLNYDHPSEKLEGIETAEALCQEQCTVCGIGSLFVAAVKKNDKLPLTDFLTDVNVNDKRDAEVRYLSKWFDSEQLDQIEDYYERNVYANHSPIIRQDNDNADIATTRKGRKWRKF